MNGLKKEEGASSNNSSKSVKKTNFIVTFAIFVVENNLWEQYLRMTTNVSEEEIQKINEDQKEKIEKYDGGIPFLHDKISLKNNGCAFIFYNKGVGYTDRIAGCIKAEHYIFASLENDGSFNVYFFREIRRHGAHFKRWNRQISEPKLKPLSFEYAKEDELHGLSSLFSLGTCEGSEKFRDFGFDIDFSSLHNSIKMFESKVAKLYPSVKTNPADRDYFHHAIEETFDTAIGPLCIATMKREENISIISNGKLFEKGLLFKQTKEDIADENNIGLNLTSFYERMVFIKTIAFISIEGGMWEKYACKHNILSDSQIEEYNEKLLKRSKDKFAKDRVAFTMLSYHNGDKEDKTFVIYNVPFEYVEDIAKETLQESFFMLVKYYSDSFDFSRYVERGGINEYIKYMNRSSEDHKLEPSRLLEYKTEYLEGASVTELKYKDDFNEGVCKKLKNFGLNLDLSAFEGVLSEFDESIRELYPQVEKNNIDKRYLSKKIYDSIYETGIEDRYIINSGRLFESLE